MDTDSRLRAFVRGELSSTEVEVLAQRLDADPKLQQRVVELLGDPTEVGSTVASAAPPARDLATPARELKLGPLLGTGGMALVHSGTQTHLGRSVAVKSLRPGADAWARAKLIQEARVTGLLEHPGIVPVHDLIEDEHGEVRVVLKRIEGQSWSHLMTHPDEVGRRFTADPLDWHVSVAISVSRALQFAHERGVIHRDVKPSNVMIGEFGEVYLLDWGIAGTLAPDPRGLLPSVQESPFAGTLACMAPEQVSSDTKQMGPSTDTFLLGACLYEALYGHQPFTQRALQQRRAAPAAAATFASNKAVPPELVALVRRALEPDPAARFGSADELRRALEQYLERRDARRLAEKAARCAAEARQKWASGARVEAEHAASDAEFAFRAALELSPDPRLERERALLAADRVRFAVEHGETRAASWLLGGLEAPPPTLVSEVNRAVETEDEERRRLTRLAVDADRRFGLEIRRWLLGAFGAAWLAFWGGVAVHVPSSVAPIWGFLLAYSVVGVAVGLWFRRAMLQHRLNREMMLVHFAMVSIGGVLSFCAGELGLGVTHLLVVLMFLWALGMSAIAAIVEPLSLVPAAVWLAGAVASVVWPGALQACLAAGALVHVVGPLLVSLRVPQPPSSP